jgi:hypothetical protein
MKVVLRGIEFELQEAVPLRVKDWRELEKRGVTPEKLQKSTTVEDMAQIAIVVLRKLGREDAEQFVDEFSLGELTDVLVAMGKEEAKPVNYPTSGSSTT